MRCVLLLCVSLLVLISANSVSISNEIQDLGDAFSNFIINLNDSRIIFPGTKWCGVGDIAADSKDLGPLSGLDGCCREHDHCPDYIESKTTKHGLQNNGIGIRFSCNCEMKFYRCLKRSRNRVLANQVGHFYFNVYADYCFRNDYPITGCKQSIPHKFLRSRCLGYTTDKSKAKLYQYFDLPPFF